MFVPSSQAAIVSRLVTSPSFRDAHDLTAFLLRHTPGATVDVDDLRTVQAAVLWWHGFGDIGGNRCPFPGYLERVPAAPNQDNFSLPGMPTLVDPRPGLAASCRLAGVYFGHGDWHDDALEPLDTRHTLPTDWLFWVQTTRKALGRPPLDCLSECTGETLAGVAEVALAVYLQQGPHPFVLDLPGTVRRGRRHECALFGLWPDGPRLNACDSHRTGGSYQTLIFALA